MYSEDVVIEIVKARMDRGGMTVPGAQLAYWKSRIVAAASELAGNGVVLTASTEDSVFLADYVVEQLTNRDKPASMPEWLRLKRRERFLRRDADAAD